MASITAYYTGSCQACVRCMELYHNQDTHQAIHWHDMDKDMGDLGISHTEAVKQPLVRNREGKLCYGMDAFIAMWRELPYLRTIARIAANPIVKAVLSAYYQVYAEWRLKKHSCFRYHGAGSHLTKQ